MPGESPDQQDLHLVVFDAFSGGGVSRTVATLANHLARSRRVHVISLYRRRRVPRFPLSADIEVTVLRDLTVPEPWWHALLASAPSRLRPAPSPVKKSMSLLTDVLLRKALEPITSGTVVSTRPSLHLAVSAFARPGATTVGWDHLNFPDRFAHPVQREVLRSAVPRLAGYAVLTSADAADYRDAFPAARTDIRVMPNAVSWTPAPRPASGDSRVVVAAGRLVARKGFKRLVKAFAPLAETHPDWRLDIYGNGAQRDELAALIERRGLQRQVRLAGYRDDFRSVLAEASVFALSSTSEGFPMVLIEALSQGVPVVAYDCPRGPADIVRHGRNGLLVADGDRPGFTEALGLLMDDPALRARMADQALRDAEAYTTETVATRWEAFLADLSSVPARPTRDAVTARRA